MTEVKACRLQQKHRCRPGGRDDGEGPVRTAQNNRKIRGFGGSSNTQSLSPAARGISVLPPQILARRQRVFDRNVHVVGEHRQMPHRAAGKRFVFALEVKLNSRIRQDAAPVHVLGEQDVAEQVDHRRLAQTLCRAQRQAADRTDLLLELTRHMGVHREMT